MPDNTTDKCVVHFDENYFNRGEYEREAKGWIGDIIVELPDGRRFPLFAFDPVRLAQELESNVANGEFVVAEPGMIVVPAVTRTAIIAAVNRIYPTGYFDQLGPLPKVE